MFFLAGLCGGGGGRGPGRGRQAEAADWLVTELGQPANASQSGDSIGKGPPCFLLGVYMLGVMCHPQTVRIPEVTEGGGGGNG